VDRYADPDLSAQECRPGQLGPAAVGRALALLEAVAGAVDAGAAADALGRAVTRPKPWLAPAPAEDRLTVAALARRLRAGDRLRRSPHARVAWHDDGHDVLLFASGASWRLPARLTAVAACCAGASAFGWEAIEATAGMPDTLDLLAELAASGSLEWVDETTEARET
jgi:ribosomal protein L16 Arg81 hydroxylase